MKRFLAVFCGLVVVMSCALAIGGDDKDKKADASDSFEAIKRLAGTWESSEAGADGKPMVCEFKVTSNKSVVIETMFPGQPHEMINAYHLDGDKLVVTHYCAQGVQPRMKLASTDGSSFKFEFLDCGNLKDGQGCMGGLELVIDGDKLTERWAYRTEGKTAEPNTVFELHRKS